jgi:predicted ATPase
MVPEGGGSVNSTLLQLRILATSREALGVAGEVKWLVPPLTLSGSEHPPTAENLMRFESTRLFLERAQSHNPALVLTPRNARG